MGSELRFSSHRLALALLAVISSIAFVAHGIPRGAERGEAKIPNTLQLSSRADTANYGIYPKDTSNEDQATAITNLLNELVADKSQIYVSDTSKGTFFWAAPLTPADAEKVASDPNVNVVVQECTSNCPDPTGTDEPNDNNNAKDKRSVDKTAGSHASRIVKRDDGYVRSQNAAQEMIFVSLPLGESIDDYQDFVYDKSAGTGVTVYIIDSGAELSNDAEFGNIVNQNVRWIPARGLRGGNNDHNDVKAPRGHGTGVLDKAAGTKYGVAKRINPVIVRIPSFQALGDPAAWLDAVRDVFNDWEPIFNRNPKTATAVLNMSWGWSRAGLQSAGYDTDRQNAWIAEFRRLLQDCVDIGILPVAPSGNGPTEFSGGPPNVPIDEYPQLFATGLSPDVANLLVVGGVGIDGNLWYRSKVSPDPNLEFVKVHAPCYDINIADGKGDFRPPAEVEGVSYASGTVAGLAAYFLGLSSLDSVLKDDDPTARVRKIKTWVETGTPIRRGNSDDIKSLWNTADPRSCPHADPPPGTGDGDEVPCGSTSSTEGDTVVAIPHCFITTASPEPSIGITSDSTFCSCEGGTIAGIGSATVSGTTYTWCQTGGLPSGVPSEATAMQTPPPATTSADQTPPPPPPTDEPVPLESQCIHVFTDPPTSTATCTTSISKSDLSTPLPDGAWTCIERGFTTCYCQAADDAQPCLPADQIAAGKKRQLVQVAPNPTARP